MLSALLSPVPRRLTAPLTAQDGEVPCVGEVGERRHRIRLRVRPCNSRPTLDRRHGHCTVHTNNKPLSHSPTFTLKKTSVLHIGRTRCMSHEHYMLQNLILNNSWFLRTIFHALPHSIVRSQRTASQCQLRGQPHGNRMRACMVRWPRHLLMFLPSPCWCRRRFRLGW